MVRDQVHKKMERTSRVQPRHRKDNWWRKIQFTFHTFPAAKTNEEMLNIDEWIRQCPAKDEQQFNPGTCSRRDFSWESRMKFQFRREGRKDVIRKFCKIRQEMQLTSESWSPRTAFVWSRSSKDSEVWKVRRQSRRKIGRTCKSSHGCISCTKSSGPESMQKLPKRRTEARWQKHALQRRSRISKNHNGAHQFSQWHMYALANIRLSSTDRSGSWRSPWFGIHYSYFKSFGTCQFVSSTDCRGPLRLCLVSGGKLLGGMSLRARLTWKGHRKKGRWKAMDRVVGMRSASPSLADISSSSVTMLIWHLQGWHEGITPQDTRVSVRWNQGSGHVSQVLMWHCSSQCTYTYSHCDLTCMTSPSRAQKTHLHPRVKWSVHFHFLNVCSLLFVICCFSICVFSCCVLLMHHDLPSKCFITLQCTVYNLLTTNALFSIFVVRVCRLIFSFIVLMTLSSSYLLFVNFCLSLSTAYYLQLTHHNV